MSTLGNNLVGKKLKNYFFFLTNITVLGNN